MRLIIVGAGFAGMYAALAAARLRDLQGISPDQLEIELVAPQPTLVVRPRLYEPKPETLTAPLLELLEAIDVRYVQGTAETVDTRANSVGIVTGGGERRTLAYDRLVLATGSRLFRPDIPGLTEHVFSVDQLDDAVALDRHLHGLARQPVSAARDTVVVAGGGFTGIEAATEMPARLRAILGDKAAIRVVIVDRNDAIAPDMGAGPRPVIENALRKVGVETRLGAGVASVDAGGVTLNLDHQVSSDGATWLDRELASRERTPLAEAGFGREVSEAMERRRQSLVDQGHAVRLEDRVVRAPRDILARLERAEIARVGREMAAERGMAFVEAKAGEYISGKLTGSVNLASGRFAMIDDGMGFQLVPWQPTIEKRIGQHVTGTVRDDGGIEWSFGRKRGLGL